MNVEIAMNDEKDAGAASGLSDVLATKARVAFAKMIKEENFFRPEYSRQSLKAHWSGDPVDAEQAAREYLRNLERNGYRITEAILVTNEDAYAGKPISVIHAGDHNSH